LNPIDAQVNAGIELQERKDLRVEIDLAVRLDTVMSISPTETLALRKTSGGVVAAPLDVSVLSVSYTADSPSPLTESE